MVASVFPYLILLLLYVSLSYYESLKGSSKNFVRIVCYLTYIFFFGASGYIGSDWYNYKEMYELVESGENVSNIEVGFVYFVKLSVFFGLPFTLFKFLVFALQGYLLDRFLSRYVKNISFFYILMISLSPLLIIDAYRNFTAILIVLNGITLLLNGRLVLFFAVILFGCLFHVTVIIYVLLFFMYKSYFNKTLLILLAMLFVLFIFIPVDIVPNILNFLMSITGNSKFALYLVNIKPYGLTTGVIEKFVVFIFLIITYNFSLRKLRIPPVFFNCSCVYFVIYLFGYEVSFIIERFSLLFVCLYFVFLVNFIFGLRIHFNRYVFFLIMLSLGGIKAELTFDKPIYIYSNSLISTDDEYDRERIRHIYYTAD